MYNLIYKVWKTRLLPNFIELCNYTGTGIIHLHWEHNDQIDYQQHGHQTDIISLQKHPFSSYKHEPHHHPFTSLSSFNANIGRGKKWLISSNSSVLLTFVVVVVINVFY